MSTSGEEEAGGNNRPWGEVTASTKSRLILWEAGEKKGGNRRKCFLQRKAKRENFGKKRKSRCPEAHN